jgi:hypothetical protein
MKTTICAAVLLCAMILCAGSALARESNFVAAVIDGKTADRVHLREQPSTSAKSLGLYFTGTEVLCGTATISNEWTWVNVGMEAGYIKTEFLYVGANLGGVTPRQPIGAVTSTGGGAGVSLHYHPEMNSGVAGSLNHGDRVTILGETASRWYYVKVGNQYGYVMTDGVQMGGAGGNSGNNGNNASNTSAGNIAPSRTEALSALKAVLLDSAPFIHAFENTTLTMGQLPGSPGDGPMQIIRFAILDLDRDGVPEVILEEEEDYGYVILRYQDGRVYGYPLGYRSFKTPRTDGTFEYSSGVMDFGFGILNFDRNTLSHIEMTYCVSGENDNPTSFFVNRVPATEKEFDAAFDAQYNKPEATWYDFTKANIEAVLSGM